MNTLSSLLYYILGRVKEGDINIDTSAASGDDYDLTQSLTSLGWLTDVVSSGVLGGKKLLYKILSVPMVIEQGTSGIWTYRKWSDGTAECWGQTSAASHTYTGNGGYFSVSQSLPSGLFATTPSTVVVSGKIIGNGLTDIGYTSADSATSVQTYLINRNSSAVTNTGVVYWMVKGRWK